MLYADICGTSLLLMLLSVLLLLLLFWLLLLLLVIGFAESVYQGEERGEAHSVQAGYISGLPDNRIISLAPTSITAGELVRIDTHSFCQSSKLYMIVLTSG